MLALNIKPGEFLAIGDSVLRLVPMDRHTRRPIRIAIDTDAQTRVLRFDAGGNLLTLKSKVIGSAHAPALGGLVLQLKCGHSAIHHERVEALECKECVAAARPVCEKVKALAALLEAKPEPAASPT